MMSDWQDQATAVNTYLPILNRYYQGFQTEQLTPKDLEAMKVLTTEREKTSTNLLEIPQGALTDIITGEPMTGYSQRLMQGTMTKDQYDKLSPAGQRMVADYFHAVMGNMIYSRERLKGSPRAQQIVQAEMNNIPLPFIDRQSANAYFRDTFADIQNFRANIPANVGMFGTPAAGGQFGMPGGTPANVDMNQQPAMAPAQTTPQVPAGQPHIQRSLDGGKTWQ
jgi:hypothetical protein